MPAESHKSISDEALLVVNNEQDFTEYFITQGKTGTDIYRQQLKHTVDKLSEILNEHALPAPNAAPESVIGRLANSKQMIIENSSADFDKVLDNVLVNIVKQSVMVNHPDCCAHLHCPPLIPALAGEVILTAINQSMDSWDQAPAATALEQQLIDWLCQHIHYGNDADGSFTSGGTQSNLMGLLLARDKAITKRIPGYSVQQQGLPAEAKRYRVLCSEVAHFTINKSCALLGLGCQAVINVTTNSRGEMCIDALKSTLKKITQEGDIPLAIVATAGTTDLGSIDPLTPIAIVAQQYDTWLHVDAAYGGALLFSDYRYRLDGLALADSITIDFHKLFFQPISCSALLVKDKKHLKPLCFHADYLSREDDTEPNLVDKSLSTTRRFDALKLWMSLKIIGLTHFSNMIGRLFKLAQHAAQLIEKTPQLELLMQPSLSTVLFRAVLNKPINSHFNLDDFQKQLRKTLIYSGKAVIAETKIKGTIYLKLTLLNPCTNQNDLNHLITLIANTAKTLEIDIIAA